jgi:hypothetical protein
MEYHTHRKAQFDVIEYIGTRILDFSAPRCFGTFYHVYSNSSKLPLLRNKAYFSLSAE